MTDTATETLPSPWPIAGEWPGLTDADVPVIGWSIIADRPELAYLADPEAGRPATAAEMGAVEAAAHAEYQAVMLARESAGKVPRGPWPHSPAATAVPEPQPEVEPEPQAGPQPESAEDPAPVLDPIAELALQRFNEQQDAQDEREGTTVMPAAEQHTEAIPAVPADGAQ